VDDAVQKVLHTYFVLALTFILDRCPPEEAARLEQHLGFGPGEIGRVLAGETVLAMERQAQVAEHFGCSLGKLHYMGQDLRHNLKVEWTPPVPGQCGCGGHHH
jgi:hypothetical protein